MTQPSERRQYVLDTEDARYAFTARPVIDPNVDGHLVSFTEVQDFRRIPRPPQGHATTYIDSDGDERCECGKWLEPGCYEHEDHLKTLREDQQ